MSESITVEKLEGNNENNIEENNGEIIEEEYTLEPNDEQNKERESLLESQRQSYSENSEEPPESILESNNEDTEMTEMTDMTGNTCEIDLQKDTLYQILSSVLEDDEGNNLTETVGKIAESSQKNYENFESIARNLRTISDGIVKHNKSMDRIVSLFERFVDLQMDDEPNVEENQ